MIKVSFAARRPEGAYALAIPVRGEDMLARPAERASTRRRARSPSAPPTPSASSARPAPIAETFVEDGDAVRRLLLVGLAAQQAEDALYERIGGALTARLLTSGETRLVVDLTGLRPRAPRRGPARLRRGGAQLALRPLPHQARPQAEADARPSSSSSARPTAPRRNGRTRRPCSKASTSTRVAGHRAGQHRLSRKLRRALPRGARRARRRVRSARRESDGEARHGRPARRRARARCGRRGCS